jgi:MFS family permease
MGPLAGVFVDRLDKRRTMLWTDALRAILIALLIPLPGTVSLLFGSNRVFWQLGAIYVIVCITSTCTQFFSPAQQALTADVVAEPDLARATGRSQASMSLASMVGPALAGILYVGFGVQLALLLQSLSYVVSLATALAIQAPPPARSVSPEQGGHFLSELTEGLVFYARNQVPLTILIAGMLFMFGVGALNALDVFFVTQNLHASSSFFGFLDAAWGIGAMIGSALAGFVIKLLGTQRALWLSTVAVGAAIILYSRQTTLIPALIILAGFGFPNAVANVARRPLMLAITPRVLVGRVFSVFNTAVSVAELLAVSLVGYLDSTVLNGVHGNFAGVNWGPLDTMFTIAGILIVLGGLYEWVILRRNPLNQRDNNTQEKTGYLSVSPLNEADEIPVE